MANVNSLSCDPATTTFTFFFQSAHNADRSVVVNDGSVNSTNPKLGIQFISVPRRRPTKPAVTLR